MFSILVSNYNNGRFFKDLYSSIIRQTNQNFEVIIVDDGSTDDSVDIIKNTIKSDKRFKLYCNNKSFGRGYTKRKCVELASGNISGFVSPYDALTDEALEIMRKEHKNNPKIVGVYSQYYECDENLIPKKVQNKNKSVKNGDRNFFNTNNRISHFFTFKTDIYRKTEKINPKYKIAENYDLYLKMYEKGSLKFIKKPCYLRRKLNKAEIDSKYLKMIVEDTLKRRRISTIYGRQVSDINNVFNYLHNYQNKLLYRVKEKTICFLYGLA